MAFSDPTPAPGSSVPVLEMNDVHRHFMVKQGLFDPQPSLLKAVDGVSLAVAPGETLGLVGESGCGKSTLARMAVRLLQPTSGDIRIQGASLWQGGAARVRDLPRKAQMIFQDPFSSLNPRQTVGGAIGEGLAVHGMGRAARLDRVRELLEWVGLEPEHAHRYPHEFSGGQRQRVAIARALALGPSLVVCDEPVSALDVSIQAQVLNLLRDLQHRLGLTYLFISHDLSVVSHISDRVAVMYLGRLVELGPAHAIHHAPLHPYTQALLAALPKPDPTQRNTSARLSGDIPSPFTPPPGCPFHPRCPHAMPVCAHTRPQWTAVEPGRFAACHLHT
ncbi:MAG: ABC transporter ATP-binding protein [Desulfovibrionaceae bacterium]